MAHAGETKRVRRVYLVLAMAFIAFAMYGSLLPFDFHRVPLREAWEQFQTRLIVLPAGISRSDALANVLLFVPIGFAAAGSLLFGRRRWFVTIGAASVVLAVGLGLSVLAEFLETFTMGRVPSAVDIGSQLTGSFIGIVAWLTAGPALTTWLRDTIRTRGADRLSRVLTAYAAAWVFFNLAPFDITVDVGELAARVRSGAISIVPFATQHTSVARAVWDVLATSISAVPLGMLGVVGWSTHARRPAGVAFVLGASLVALVECAQIFIESHGANGTNVLSGWVGVAVGVWAAQRFMWRGLAAAPATDAARRGAVMLFTLWCAVLAAYHWLPYDFTVDNAAIKEKLEKMSLLPFAGYRQGAYLNAFTDLMTKLALSTPLGLFAAFVLMRGRAATRLLVLGWMLAAAGIFGTIEVGQFFLPSRVPDPTDVLVGVAGSTLGLALGWWLQRAQWRPGGRSF